MRIRSFFEIESMVDPYREEYKFNLDKELVNMIPGSTKMRDYLNLVRTKAIEEIKKAKEKNLDRYEIEKEKYNRDDMTSEKVEEMRRDIFKEDFCFLLKTDNIFGEQYSIPYKFVTIRTDFYVDTFDLHELIE